MSGSFPKWLESWLGAGSAGSGEGTLWILRDSWPLPPWATVLLIVFSVAFMFFCYLREAGNVSRGIRLTLATIRSLLVCIILFMLAQFMLSLERTGLPYVVVMVDDSQSMGIEDRYNEEKVRAAIAHELATAGLEKPSRLNVAKSVLLADNAMLLRAIDERYKLKLYYLDDTVRAQSGNVDQLASNLSKLEPTGESTRLGQGIRTVLNDLRGTPPTAIILLSDGINTEGDSLVRCRRLRPPQRRSAVHVALGSETPVHDLELSDLLVDDVVFVDDVVNFEFNLTTTGYAGRTVEITLHERGKDTALASIRATANPDGKPQKLRIPYRPTQVGEFEYVVEVERLGDELHADNNRQQRLVSVRKEQIRVLLVQSYPNFEFRYLKEMLHRDSTIELKTVLQESDLQYAETDKTALRVFPERKEDLFEYDVILFGDVDPAFLSSTAMQNIAAFVTEKGGGVVLVAGPLFTPQAYRDSPLANLVPIDFNGAVGPDPGESITDGFQVIPTELGASMPPLQLGDTIDETAEIWRKLPPLYWLFEAADIETGRPRAGRKLRPRRQQAAGHLSAICRSRQGLVPCHGRNLALALSRGGRLLRPLLGANAALPQSLEAAGQRPLGRIGSRSPGVSPRRIRPAVGPFSRRSQSAEQDDGVTVIIEQEGQQNRRVQLHRNPASRGMFEGLLSKPPVGKYHAWIATPALEGGGTPVDFRVVPAPGEFERVQMELAEMKRAAELTKGHWYTTIDTSKLLSDLPPGQPVPIETLPPIVLWNQWPLLLIFLTLIVGEWVMRKQKGML